jgi:transcriptional regulator with XRE-family HTH domain
MPESFGARLRQQREKHGIALEALAKQTRIKESLLEALERDDLSQWPSGFYRRAFFRAYAAAIQLNPDDAFREFQEVYPEPPAEDVLTAMAATLGRAEGSARTAALRTAVESAFTSLARLRSTPTGEPPPPAPAKPAPPHVDLAELATLCVEFGCVRTAEAVDTLLERAARVLRAAGLIVWTWDPRELKLHAALVYGYPPRIVAQLPAVRRADNNATAEAFRTVGTRVLNDTAAGKCALAIPMRTTSGCVGVFAVELEPGVEADESRVAVATVLAAQVAPIVDCLAQPAPVRLARAMTT